MRIGLVVVLWCCSVVAWSAGGVLLSYTLPKATRVSINIYAADGPVVRELLHGAPRTAGAHTEIWNGCDEQGKPAPAGTYRWKLLGIAGLSAEYLLTIGSNYPDGDNYTQLAPGCHGGPSAVAVDETGVYVAASCTENIENYLVKTTRDGAKRLWSAGNHIPWTGGASMAVAGDTLYVLGTNGEVWPYDAATGTRKTTVQVAWDGDKAFPYDLDARTGELVVAYANHDTLRWFDTAGKLLDEVTGIKAPCGVALAADGAVYVVSDTSIFRVSRAEKTPVPFITGLIAPGRLAVERASGDLLVIEGGEKQQVSRFGADGKRKAVYGRAGGRQDGLYTIAMQESFCAPSDIAIDPHGGFAITEPNAAPRRTSLFTANGHLAHEWYGGQVWAPWVTFDPDDPTVVWMASDWGGLMRVTVNYQTHSWKVHSVYHTTSLANGLVGGQGNGWLWDARKHNGVTYLCKRQQVCVLRVDEKNWRLLPAAVGNTHIRHYWNAQPQLIKDWAGAGDDSYLWTDANGDGQPQREEMVFHQEGGNWTALPMVDDSMQYTSVINGKPSYIQQYPLAGWNAVGSPRYADFPMGKKGIELPSRVTSIEGRWGSYLYKDPLSGEFFGAFNDAMPGFGESKDSFLVKWNANGALQWMVGKTLGHATQTAPPGVIGTFRRIAGRTHGCLVLTDFYEGDHPATTYVWDGDGLWVGGIMDNVDLRTTPLWKYGLGAETLSSTLFTDHKTGEVLFMGHGINEGRIYRISGWDGWVHLNGAIKLAASPPEGGTGLRADYCDDAQVTHVVATRVDPLPQWPSTALPAGVKPGTATVRWSGQLLPEFSELYTFTATTTGGVRLVIDGRTLIDAWTPAVDSTPAELPLTAGKLIDIQLEYTAKANSRLSLTWESPSRPREVIPTTRLFPLNPVQVMPAGHGKGVLAEYYRGGFDEKNKVATRVEQSMELIWGVGKAPEPIGTGHFSARFTAFLQPRQTGMYTILLDWPRIGVLWIDGKRVGPFWPVVNDTIYLEAGKLYPVKLEYTNAGSHPSTNHGIHLQWSTPAGAAPRIFESIPSCQWYLQK